MTGPAAGLTTWLDRPLTTTGHTHSTESHEPEWLTQLCALECTLQVRAHSLAPATCRDSANRPTLGPSDHEPPRAPLLVSFLGTPLQLSPLHQANSSPTNHPHCGPKLIAFRNFPALGDIPPRLTPPFAFDSTTPSVFCFIGYISSSQTPPPTPCLRMYQGPGSLASPHSTRLALRGM